MISPVIKGFSAACLNPQCGSIKCSTCKRAVTTTGLTLFDASCLFGYINGGVSTVGREPSSETYLCIDLGETTEYISKLKIIHRGYTLGKSTGANWMSFDDNCTSCIDLAEFHHPQVHIRAGCLLVRKANGKWRLCVDYLALNTGTV